MADAGEDLVILYRAVCRRRGRAPAYAGCVTAREAAQLLRMGVARLIDLLPTSAEQDRPGCASSALMAEGAIAAPDESSPQQFVDTLRRIAAPGEALMFLSETPGQSDAAATLAARAGFHCCLSVLDGRSCYRAIVAAQKSSMASPDGAITARSTSSRFSGEAKVSMKS
jgi:hypothetical protein